MGIYASKNKGAKGPKPREKEERNNDHEMKFSMYKTKTRSKNYACFSHKISNMEIKVKYVYMTQDRITRRLTFVSKLSLDNNSKLIL